MTLLKELDYTYLLNKKSLLVKLCEENYATHDGFINNTDEFVKVFI
jgi:hypothetical protein